MGNGSPLHGLIAAEIAAGNTVATRWQDECDRDVVQFANALHHEWRRVLDARGAVWRFEREMRRTSQDDFEFYDWEKIESADALVIAPRPSGAAREERTERDRTAGRLLPESDALPDHPFPRGVLLARCADCIERDLRATKEWRDELAAPPPFRAAFGMDAMPFTTWLQFVFLPRLRTIAAAHGKLPAPGVAAHAVRELDGRDDLSTLLSRLSWIDREAALDHPSSSSVPREGFRFLGVVTAYVITVSAVAVVALALGTELADRVDGWQPKEHLGSVGMFEVRGLRSAPESKLELRVHGQGGDDGASHVSSIELVQISKPRFTGIEPGLFPLTIESDEPVAVSEIHDWLVLRDADPALALDDAAKLHAYAAALASAPNARDVTTLLPPAWTLESPAEISSYEIPQPAWIRLTIQMGTLLVFVLPAAWYAVLVGRRVLRGS